jgi:putative transposase
MRSQTDYIITKTEVYQTANHWLTKALRLNYVGTKCSTSVVFQVLLLAAARVVSIFAACRNLTKAPSDQSIRNALAATLPEVRELEARLNRALATRLPKALRRKARMIAIDLTLIPYHGQPAFDEKEIYRSEPKSGTTHFHAYATAVVVHKGHRYTLALTRVEYGEKMPDVVKRLVRIVRRRGIKLKILLLDKGFFSVAVFRYLKRAGYGYIVPAVVRGRKPQGRKPATGLRAIQKKNHGYYPHTLTGDDHDQTRTCRLTICVASKSYTNKKTGKPARKKLMYAIWKVRLTPREIRETYRRRFGIETSYRQMNEARIRTSTRDPQQRLLFVGIALVLRNVWVWLHFQFAKGKWNTEPQLFLELLRFQDLLHWIMQIVEDLLGANEKLGLDCETYQRVTAKD